MPEPWDGEERRRGPTPANLQSELKAVRQDVGRLATSVATLGSDERMQRAIESVVEEEQRHRQRILLTIVVGLLVVGALTAVGITFSGSAKDAAEKAEAAAVDSARVASYVENCLVRPDRATPGECGNTAATGQQSAAVLAIFCYLRIDPGQRTDQNAAECFRQAIEQAKASAATTTTR
jgi:hypothetical protein